MTVKPEEFQKAYVIIPQNRARHVFEVDLHDLSVSEEAYWGIPIYGVKMLREITEPFMSLQGVPKKRKFLSFVTGNRAQNRANKKAYNKFLERIKL